MYTFNIKENCKELKNKLKQQYTNVTDDDLQCDGGRKEEMLEKLQQKLGKTREEVHQIIFKL
jgi:uncharacterized protein YjbJ (UPF0337 family)